MNSEQPLVLKRLVPFAVLFAGVAIVTALILTRPRPKPAEIPESSPPLVEWMTVSRESAPLTARAQGTVQPKTEITLSAQVAGKVLQVADEFSIGAEFDKGTMLLQIEDVDYQLAVKQARAQVKQAEYSLTLAKANQQVAKSDLETFRSSTEGTNAPSLDPQSPLALYEPQVENAQAAVESAQANLERAQLNLQRTRVRAPFAGRVRRKLVDVGQFVNMGTPLAHIYSRSPLQIIVSLPLGDLSWLLLPEDGQQTPELPAEVSALIDGQTHVWNGTLVRSLGELDEVGRLARFLVEVEDLLSDRNLELKVGQFVDVSVVSARNVEVMRIPQSALSRDGTVWVVAPDHTLSTRRVQTKLGHRQMVVVMDGLIPGEKILTVPLPEAVPGMKVSLTTKPPSPEQDEEAAE